MIPLILQLAGAPLAAHAEAPPCRIKPVGGLRSIVDIPDLRELWEQWVLLPKRTTRVPTIRNGRTVHVAVHETGTGLKDSIVVLVHGILSSHEVWQFVAPNLIDHHDVWLIDLPGCGWSDKPHPKDLGSDGYSPAALSDRVLQTLEFKLRERGARGTTPQVWLVGHSLGGTIVLRGLMEPELRTDHAETIGAVAGVVVLSPCDVELPAPIPCLQKIVDLKPWELTLGRWLGLVRKQTDQCVREGYFNPNRATQEESSLLAAILESPACRRALQAMLREAVPWDLATGRPDWEEVERLTALYGEIDMPCLLVWGERDEVLNECMGHKMKDKIRGAQLLELGCCGHSSPRECPRKVAAVVDKFIDQTRLSIVAATPAKVQRGPVDMRHRELSAPGSALEDAFALRLTMTLTQAY